jgi:hypothetical protein
MTGYVLGRPGGSLGNSSSWLGAGKEEQAKVGADAERKTALVTDQRAKTTEAVVLHDLRIPLPGYKANIDHVWVSGDTVIVMDTKQWAGGTYWTLFGKTRNGFKLVPHADKRTISAAVVGISKYLTDRGIKLKMATPLLVVWSKNPISHLFYRPAGAKFVSGDVFKRDAVRLLPGKKANPAIVNALSELLI